MTFEARTWWNTAMCAEFLGQRHRDGTLNVEAARDLLNRFPDKVQKSRLYGRSVRYWGEDVIALPQMVVAHTSQRQRPAPAPTISFKEFCARAAKARHKEKDRDCA